MTGLFYEHDMTSELRHFRCHNLKANTVIKNDNTSQLKRVLINIFYRMRQKVFPWDFFLQFSRHLLGIIKWIYKHILLSYANLTVFSLYHFKDITITLMPPGWKTYKQSRSKLCRSS